MREIVLDTETTGMDPDEGHKIVEIGCVELVNHLPTGRTWQTYLNPEREVDSEATAVHGIKTEFLKDKPTFGEIVGELMDFIAEGKLIIHNAEFDIKFLNAELKPYGFPPIKLNDVTDTLFLARKKYPGQPANLDALCRRFGVDLSDRTFHGALLDSHLLAQIYLELMGGRQHGLGLGAEDVKTANTPDVATSSKKDRLFREPRFFPLSSEEKAVHQKMLDGLKDHLWQVTH